MANYRRRLKVNKLLMPTAVILIVLVFVIAAAMYGLNPPPAKSKEPADEYFRAQGAVLSEYGYQEVNQTSGKYYIIKAMGFNITAVEGDAHGVVVYWKDGVSDEVELLRKGESVWVEVTSRSPVGAYIGPVNGSSFQTEIRLASSEAEGDVTITVS